MAAEAAARGGAGAPAWRRFAADPVAAAAGLFLAALLLAAAAAPWVQAWLGADPAAVDLLARLEPPSAAHPLGTDELGRDLLLRLLYGGRVSLAVGLGGALLAALIGTLVGLAAGYAGGGADALLMRLTDAVISLPLLPLLIVLAAVDLAKLGLPPAAATGELAGVARIVAIVALFGWTTTARLVRASVLSLRTREFVHAARALGAGPVRILARHVLPNAAGPLIVATTLSIGNVILVESVLSFLGLGVQPPLPSWGNMLTGAQELLFESPRLAWWPGLLIFLTVLAFNVLGDGLQAALDPRRG
jgi:peptide/nickel transport system permease protein